MKWRVKYIVCPSSVSVYGTKGSLWCLDSCGRWIIRSRASPAFYPHYTHSTCYWTGRAESVYKRAEGRGKHVCYCLQGWLTWHTSTLPSNWIVQMWDARVTHPVPCRHLYLLRPRRSSPKSRWHIQEAALTTSHLNKLLSLHLPTSLTP